MLSKMVLASFILCLAIPAFAWSADPQNISVEEAKRNIEEGAYALLLDVRTPEEFQGEWGHIQGGRLLPIQELDARLGEIGEFKEKRILVYCASGGRSSRAVSLLVKKGFLRVENMLGGMKEWNKKGYPVAR